MNQTTQALCAHCRVPLERVAEPNPEDRYACSLCGNGDTYDAVMREISDYVAEVAAESLSSRMTQIAGRSDILKVAGRHRPSGRAWRFIVNVEL